MKILIFILSLIPVSSFAFNLVGGKYSNLNDAATARVRGATAAYLNPAGLAFEESSSISSGASAYNYEFSNQNGERSVTTSSSTSHVAAIEETENYIFGFMIYTSFDLARESSQSNYTKNSEGYNQGSASKMKNKVEQNIYIFAMAPKKANWGASLNFIQTSSQVQVNTSAQNYSSDATKRLNKVSHMSFNNQDIQTHLTFGQQFRLNERWKFGYKLTSPTYLLTGSGNYQYDQVQLDGTDSNNATLTNIHYDVDTETVYHIQGEALRLGFSYFHDDWIYSLDFFYTSGYNPHKTISKNRGEYSIWISQSDLYIEDYSDVTHENSDSEHNSLVFNTSIEFLINDNESFGGGISYVPTSAKGGKGTDELIASIGYSKKYKNFLGSYGLNYQKAFDTGKNTMWDDSQQKEVPTREEYESISFLLSGAYYF